MPDNFDRYFNRFAYYLKAERNASPHTIRNYGNDLRGNYLRGEGKGFFQFLRLKGITSLEEVDRHTLRDYASWLIGENIVRASIARRQSAIRSLYRYLTREGILSTNPIRSASSPKLDRRLPSFLTVEEARRLVESPDLSKPEGKRDRALLELLYASGLRISELVNLNLENLNLDANEIRVWGKGSKERLVLIGQPAAQALATYLSEARPVIEQKNNNAVFLSKRGTRLSARKSQKLLERYSEVLGKRVHPHMLRHTFATHLLDGGADLRVVQELMGHSSLVSTQIYTHVSKSQARKIYLLAHPLAKKNEQTNSKQTAETAGRTSQESD